MDYEINDWEELLCLLLRKVAVSGIYPMEVPELS
jgi:hypothetical protein